MAGSEQLTTWREANSSKHGGKLIVDNITGSEQLTTLLETNR
jgi:hypothetical protein